MLLDTPYIKRVARKELGLFFSSPIAYLFLGVFVSVTLFIFFWGESFYARNIADVRPMFEWMPILLILLSAALTMRMWSEERRSGTLEHVMTLPQSPWSFILGKFWACLILLTIALALTLPLPITISLFANLDWGPVVSAYFATLALGSAYLAIGLFISSRSDNQIVSLILTIVICGLFYLIGANVFTRLLGNQGGDILRALATGARFESITRGVLDLRDFYYYVSITLVFLFLNRYTLEKERWASHTRNARHRGWKVFTVLALANVLLANLWLYPLGFLRLDTTEGHIYSISDATRSYIKQLREPLIIKGYFSEKTHPLLAPLVPQLKDLLKEYEEVGHGKIRVEFIDPAKNAEEEEEAGNKYGIKPVPFRVADRYEAAVVNSYFNVVVQYGEEYKVLGFQDLIEVKSRGEGDLDVELRNPEYDITNAIKQSLYAYQKGGNLFDSVQKPVTLTAYVSNPQQLPASLATFASDVQKSLQDMKAKAKDKLVVNFVDPEANGGAVAKKIEKEYGFRPMASNLFDNNTFYFYMVLSDGSTAVQIPLPEKLDKAGFERDFNAGLKRFAQGFLKTVGLVLPKSNPYAAQMGMPPGASFHALEQVLNQNMTTRNVDLSGGVVPGDIDLLLVMSPESVSQKELFAIDQFLMKGGTVIMATSPFKTSLSRSALSAQAHSSGLENWLKYEGVDIDKTLVMDTQNAAFPLPVTRQVGMFQVQEMRMLDYPYFVEVQGKGLNSKSPVTSSLQNLTMPWASPITLDQDKNKGRDIVELVHSSPSTWLSDSTKITPEAGKDFVPGTFVGSKLLAVAITGKFPSWFKGKESPLLSAPPKPEQKNNDKDKKEPAKPDEVISSVIDQSAESARLIVVGSNSFAEDQITSIMGSINGNNYVAPFELLTNAIEWSLEDEGLMSIRSRAHFNRTLPSMDEKTKQFWEYLNYFLALFGVVVVFIVRKVKSNRKRKTHQALLNAGVNVQ